MVAKLPRPFMGLWGSSFAILSIQFRPSVGKKVTHAVTPDGSQDLRLQIRYNHCFFAADIVCQYISGWTDDHRYPRKIEPFLIIADLVAGYDEQSVVKRSGRQVTHPGVEFFLGRSPG